jgi:hypothetical protein
MIEAQRFVSQRGFRPGQRGMAKRTGLHARGAQSPAETSQSATWQALGPVAVQTQDFGLVTGRVSSLALDPSDATGNHLYLGTTGGGVWVASNAASSPASSVVFTPLTDAVNALGGATNASISIGALTVQPGGTGVILAGTGDPNDVLDSYYGAGILRSTDGGTTWSLIQATDDLESGLGYQDSQFIGEGFAGFAWSTVNQQVVVAAVSQAYEGTLVNAGLPGSSYEGLYYSNDSGATWRLATITDGSGQNVQGPVDPFDTPDGNAATAVVWNPVRQLFIAAVRYHGYYQSPDGVTWTRLAAQPGAGLTTSLCPTNPATTGSIACPIFRGALAVNPVTGDTFAWTVDLNNQDQGLWQDICNLSGGACGNAAISFGTRWNTAPIETSTMEGASTIANGNYNLALAAIPSAQDTLLLAGANDLWKCSLAAGCAWRNTTNSTTCMSAAVGEFQHALAWNSSNPLEVLLGNDSGLWRSMDAIGETGTPCSASDSTHFQNLNGSLGSLAEVVSLGPVLSSPYTMIAGLGVNGTAGVKAGAAIADWPQILSGYGGPVAIDPLHSYNWYVNAEAGVSIYLCSESSACTPADFGSSPVVSEADVANDGLAMLSPAPFLVDPLDPTQLLIGTCRLWRGPAHGSGWSSANAMTPILDSGATTGSCSGDALIRSMAALALPSGAEVIYLGMYGSLDGGSILPGHVWSVTIDPASGNSPVWSDLTLNPVANDSHTLNFYGYDISSIFIDPHDTTGNTVYVTVEGFRDSAEEVQIVYGTTDGGAQWTDLTSNLPDAPANSVVVDPQDAKTIYVATDQGLYFTSQVQDCAQPVSVCWSPFGTGLPNAPVVGLTAGSPTASSQVLVAATYGRGIWQTPLWSASTSLATAVALPASLSFGSQSLGSGGAALQVNVKNTGSVALSITSISIDANFSEADDCVNQSVPVGGNCAIQVTFTPQSIGAVSNQMTIFANVYGGQLAVDLDGTGTSPGPVSVTPMALGFEQTAVGSTSAAEPITASNSSGVAIPITSLAVTGPFVISDNLCGTVSLAANTSCLIQVEFQPTQTGAASGTLTLTDGEGTQKVQLSGTGTGMATDTLNVTSLTFPATANGQISLPQQVTITNSGAIPLTSISVSASSGFQFTNGCLTQLAANSTCTIAVQFAPTTTGNMTGTLTVADALRTQTVALSGTGVAPAAIGVNPASLTFSNQQAGVPSTPQMLTVTNTGGAALANVEFQLTGAAAASYSLATNTCAAILNAGANCTVQVIFTPSGTGSIAASLVVSSSTAGVAAVSVPLNGSGQLASALQVLPTLLTYPATGSGQTSAAQTVTITNASSYSISSIALAVTGPFGIAQNHCTGALAGGNNCTVSVVFTPSVAGTASGTLTASAAAVTNPAMVSLTGTGFDFAVSVTGSPTQTVASGQSANFPLVITPSGAEGSFTFTSGTLPANALCLFSPATETVSLGAQGNVNAQISTGQSPSASAAGAPFAWSALPLACGLMLIPWARTRRRPRLLLALLAAMLTMGVSSCATSSGGGGGGGGSGGGSSTPPGSYNIPFTVTSAGVSHSVSVTLTVD